jgi:hypothetical protein
MIEITDVLAINYYNSWSEYEDTLHEFLYVQFNEGDFGTTLNREESFRLYSLLKDKFNF